MFAYLISPFVIAVTLSTTMGILVHDMRIDKMTSIALQGPVVGTTYESNTKAISFNTDFHTHVERTSLGHAVPGFGTSNLLMKPRISEDKKHLIQKHVTKGHHAFDNYSLPLT
jgi:hypothetical protein